MLLDLHSFNLNPTRQTPLKYEKYERALEIIEKISKM